MATMFEATFEALQQAGVRFVVVDDLIAMKRLAGRAQDLLDIEALVAIQKEHTEGG